MQCATSTKVKYLESQLVSSFKGLAYISWHTMVIKFQILTPEESNFDVKLEEEGPFAF